MPIFDAFLVVNLNQLLYKHSSSQWLWQYRDYVTKDYTWNAKGPWEIASGRGDANSIAF